MSNEADGFVIGFLLCAVGILSICLECKAKEKKRSLGGKDNCC